VNLPLRELRVRANNGIPKTDLHKGESLSQDELAVRIGIAQGQVSRYEAAPETIPFELAFAWCQACGFTIEDALRFSSTEDNKGVDPGTPYEELHANLALLRQYAAGAPELSKDLPTPSLTPDDLSLKIDQWRRKPTVLITGRFDSAKTRIANALLGSENLPSQYTPTTSIVTFVRHIADKPKWQTEDVWVMKKGFDDGKWTDETHCKKFRLAVGGFETLKRFGIKESDGEKEGAKAALVYMDAPLLNACTLIDVPGFQDDESDAELATSSASLADIVLYTSPAKGFIDQADFLHLSQLLRALSPIHAPDKGLRFANFFLVATHADPSISDLDLARIVQRGAQRLNKQFGESLFLEEPRKLSVEEIQHRIFTFWFENKARWDHMRTSLLQTLSDVMPNVIRQQIDSEVKEIKARTRADLRKRIEAYENALAEIDAARNNVDELRKRIPAHKKEIQRNKAAFKAEVEKLKRGTEQFISDEIAPMLTSESIEAFIRKNFDKSKDDAKKDAIPKLLEMVQSKLEGLLKKEAEKLVPLVEKYLQKYEVTLDSLNDPQFGGFEAIPFDAQGAFAGGLAAAGTLGALGIWASAMGNLGGYILVAKLASVMSIAGFGIGSGSLVTFVSLIGGPVTLAVGLASVLALGIWSVFGEDWKARLAKKIAKTLQEKGLLDKVRERSDSFWDTTWTAFEAGADAIEEKFAEYLKKNEELLKDKDSQQKLEVAITTLEDLRDFFGGIPWRASA
jgi:transcriptional regulator with XRE-family HTH domain